MSGIENRVRKALVAEAALWPELAVESVPVRRGLQRRWVAAVAVAVATASIAGTWLVLRDVTDPTAVACYREASLFSDVADAATGGGLDALLCAPVWENGPLINEDIVERGKIPPLTGCVADQGVLAVFPTDDKQICETLGLGRANPGSFDEGNDIRQLQADLIDHFDGQECHPLDKAESDVRTILDESGFGRWQIRTGTPRPDRPCASLGVDPEAETIHLVPIPEL